jgi:Domain of unknown function (DUF4832)/NPCBM/NEW2 domain/Domain of unknown function (DUF4874)/DUF5010 C-terminal domain
LKVWFATWLHFKILKVLSIHFGFQNYLTHSGIWTRATGQYCYFPRFFGGFMKKRFAKQLKSRPLALGMTSFVLAVALIACNTTPTPTLNQDAEYLKGSKPWSSTVNASSVSSITTGFLSDQTWESAISGWGPVELDSTNGLDGSEDGQQLSLSGVKYDKGLGIHSDSSITFKLAGTCSRFTASVGLDDEVRHQGTYGNVIFRVYGEDTKLYDSGGMNRNNATQNIDLDITGLTSLTLVVDQNKNSTEGDRSNWYDHGDWANARVECDNSPQPTTPTNASPSASSVKIQFEDFKAGEGIGYHDTDTVNEGGLYRLNEGVDVEQRSNPEGYNVGWSRVGEWMNYDLNVTAGKYDLNMRFATWGTQKLRVSIDGVEISSSSLPDTAGSDQYLIFKVSSVDLNPGAHVVKVAYVGANPAINLDWMEFVPSGTATTTPITPIPVTPTPIVSTPVIPTPEGSMVSTDFWGSDANFTNPERGFYGYGSDLTNVNESNLADLSRSYSLVHSYVRLDNDRYSSLDSGWLSQLEEGFAKLRRTGLKTILRFSYNFPDGSNYTFTPDAPLDTVLTHIQQIKPILARNADVVAFWQAGFVGAWGEWHSSTNGLDSAQNKIIIRDALLDAVPNDRFLQVRYPIDLQRWNSNYPTESNAFTNNARIGIYNDCFMADDNDTGTYPDGLYDTLREYTKAVSRVTPFGAETCDVGGDRARKNCDQILTEGRDYSLTYLNDNFDISFMNNWKANGCYDEVSRLIGYRFRLTSASHQQAVNRGNTWSLQFNVSNDGWARLFNPRALKVVLRNKNTGETFKQSISQANPRLWLPSTNTSVSTSFTIPNQTSPGDYDVLIGLPDAAPSLANDARYAIRFANSDNGSLNQAWESNTGLFKIGTTLTIN